VLYLDTSATAKLLQEEAQSRALGLYLRSADVPLVTSRVGIVELRRVGRRVGAADRADALAATLVVVELDEIVEREALDVDARLRTSDAIHLATAILMGDELTAFVCYDERLATAASASRLSVVAPS
jgi:predicted nucleic acid-binding protein